MNSWCKISGKWHLHMHTFFLKKQTHKFHVCSVVEAGTYYLQSDTRRICVLVNLWHPVRTTSTLINGWATVSEKACLHQSGAGLWICKAKSRSGFSECWQCDCSVPCLGLTTVLLLSRNSSQLEEDWSCRREMTQYYLSMRGCKCTSEQQEPVN